MPKILVADDSIAVRKVAERLLTEAGLDVALAASADEAIALLANERPDLIVSDVIMPDKSGYEVCSFVRAQESLSSTPVLLISGIVNEEVTRQAESCRADGVLKKPFQGSSLKDMVLQLLAKREQRAATQPVAASTGSPAAGVSEGHKVFRITEEQLQAFRQAVSRMKEFEELLTAEREKSAKLAQRCTELERIATRVKEAEVALTCEREASAQLVERLTEMEKAAARTNARAEELARKLAEIARLSS
ncbi:MAG TPA: response regulator [Nitrospiraceae bacterium]|nr:response regulator [Nitrospiraceae bacterium]